MKTYLLVLQSNNVRTTIKVDLKPSEFELMKDINTSLIKQNALILLDVEELDVVQ